jgi:hypothetical protein
VDRLGAFGVGIFGLGVGALWGRLLMVELASVGLGTSGAWAFETGAGGYWHFNARYLAFRGSTIQIGYICHQKNSGRLERANTSGSREALHKRILIRFEYPNLPRYSSKNIS